MKIQRAFKVRLYPSPEQQVFLNKTLGCCRFLYNQMLHERIETYEALKDDREALYAYKYKTEHERIGNYRRNFIDTLPHKLVKDYDVIVVEDLSLKGMFQAMKLGKSVMDMGYSGFVNKLRYKAMWNDKTVIVADKWFAPSKTCHVCGNVKRDSLLRERSWVCPQCGTHHDRDTNAAINLWNFGKHIPVRCGELTSVDMEALVLGGAKSETIVEKLITGRSRNLVEQVEQSAQATSPRLKAGGY